MTLKLFQAEGAGVQPNFWKLMMRLNSSEVQRVVLNLKIKQDIFTTNVELILTDQYIGVVVIREDIDVKRERIPKDFI